MQRLAVTLALTLVLIPFAALAQEEAEKWGDPNDWLNKEATPIQLDVYGGGKLDTTQLKGKKPVFIEFWASWCPWCRGATEKFDEAAKKYGDKAAFYVVAVGEGAEPVKTYLEKNDFSVKFALDPDRKVADTYWVDYIPHLIAIDKDGKVDMVAVGQDDVAAALDKQLAKMFGDNAGESGEASE